MGARIGRYELIDLFATGGVAEIYRARDHADGSVVIIKRMRPDLGFDPELHAGFLRELQIALRCTHKNLIRGIDKGTVNGLDYGVLEYVDGVDLQQFLERARTTKTEVPPLVGSYLTGEVLAGLDFAHRLTDPLGQPLGIVHRDLSPKNIFIRYDGGVCVGDFGSSVATAQETQADVVGSPGYMSPEQASQAPLDGRSDLFSVGCLLFELVVGEPAFDAQKKTDAQVLKLHQRGRIKDVPKHVPDELRMIIEIACAPDPDDRYKSARDMRNALSLSDFAGRADEGQAATAALVRTLMDAEYQRTRLVPAAELQELLELTEEVGPDEDDAWVERTQEIEELDDAAVIESIDKDP